MKKKVFCCALAGALAFSALAGCSDKGGKQIEFGPYWLKDSISSGEANETLTYDVTFEKGSGLNGAKYSLAYGTGSYTATLKTIPQGYEYTTEFSIPVSFTYGEEVKEFTDTVCSTVVFDNSRAFVPISSSKTVASHTPTNTSASPKSVENCYAEYSYTVTTSYGANNQATATVEYLKTKDMQAQSFEKDFTYGKGDYSYLDNEMLLLAMRAVPSGTSSGKIKVYYPTQKAMQTVKFSFEKATAREFIFALNGAEASSKEISCRAVTLSLSANNPGPSQTAWIAAASDPKNNTNRNVLLRLETPLPYDYGKLVYALKTVTNL